MVDNRRTQLRTQLSKDKKKTKQFKQLSISLLLASIIIVVYILVININSNNKLLYPSSNKALFIPLGDKEAKNKLIIFEDLRCVACNEFEKEFSPTIKELINDKKTNLEYHLVRLIDYNSSGDGSLRAGNALGCAAAIDSNTFQQYHDILYHNQPSETTDKFGDNELLLKLSKQVDNLSNNTKFIKCVKNGKYNEWINKSHELFQKKHYQGTPTILLNGKQIKQGTDFKNPDEFKGLFH